MALKDLVIEHLKEHGTINKEEALKLGIKDLKGTLQYVYKEPGFGKDLIKTHANTRDREGYYELLNPDTMYDKPKSIRVSNEIHIGIKQVALQAAIDNKPKKESELYVEAIQLGLEKLRTKYKVK